MREYGENDIRSREDFRSRSTPTPKLAMLAKEESTIKDVDTPKRYESNSAFYNSNSVTMHNVIENNNIGGKEKRVIIVSYLVLGESVMRNKEKSEDFELSIEEDKDSKGRESIIEASLHSEVCKNDVMMMTNSDLGKSEIIGQGIAPLHEVCLVEFQNGSFEVHSLTYVGKEHVNIGVSKLACKNIFTSFMSLILKCIVWEKSILHVDHNTLLVPWDPGVLVLKQSEGMKAIEGFSPIVSTLEEKFACKKGLTPIVRRDIELEKVPITMKMERFVSSQHMEIESMKMIKPNSFSILFLWLTLFVQITHQQKL